MTYLKTSADGGKSVSFSEVEVTEMIWICVIMKWSTLKGVYRIDLTSVL